MKPSQLHFGFFVDCESTQPAINDPSLGRRADEGIAEVLSAHRMVATFHVLPTEAEANPDVYRHLRSAGHEIGLHVHPSAQGYDEFLGVYGPKEQRAILSEARDRAEQALGFGIGSLCIGYVSTNDFSYEVFYELGFRHGMTSLPTRVLPECASVHAAAPLGMHYAHRFNRSLEGDLDYVEVPVTVDPDSRMWGGKHPLDLRVELVDAKNHFYTLKKAIERQLKEEPPVTYLLGFTHNTFEYGRPDDFRRQTLEGILRHVRALAESNGLEVVPVTIGQLAAAYRQATGSSRLEKKLVLDRAGYGAGESQPNRGTS